MSSCNRLRPNVRSFIRMLQTTEPDKCNVPEYLSGMV